MKKLFSILMMVAFVISLGAGAAFACSGNCDTCPLPNCPSDVQPQPDNGKAPHCDGGSCPLPPSGDDDHGGCDGGACPLPDGKNLGSGDCDGGSCPLPPDGDGDGDGHDHNDGCGGH